ncbi:MULTISPECIES: hypothetical protein [unclassified Acinetobacter]|nr:MULTISPECIES: hypothetical protein [unclassified Acinetobacter]
MNLASTIDLSTLKDPPDFSTGSGTSSSGSGSSSSTATVQWARYL